MARITVVGNAVVVTSNMKLEDLVTIKKYRPNALTLFEGDGKEKEAVFAIGIGPAAGAINKYGATFSDETNNAEGKAIITEMFAPVGGDDLKAVISDAYGPAILLLNKLEATLPAVIEEISAEKAAIDENITIA